MNKDIALDHITIPIPEGLPEDQKRDLTAWLTEQAHEVTGRGEVIDDDPEVREEIVRRIKRGMADIAAGNVLNARQSMREIAKETGIQLNR
ncbi:MAG: tautomerase family protein [Planctomycetota bacterium]|jgi:hypothetical protein